MRARVRARVRVHGVTQASLELGRCGTLTVALTLALTLTLTLTLRP